MNENKDQNKDQNIHSRPENVYFLYMLVINLLLCFPHQRFFLDPLLHRYFYISMNIVEKWEKPPRMHLKSNYYQCNKGFKSSVNSSNESFSRLHKKIFVNVGSALRLPILSPSICSCDTSQKHNWRIY